VRRRSLAAAAAALALAACAEFGFLRQAPDLEFEISGRIAMRYGGEAATGHVAWRHGERGDEVLLTNALGQGLARIVREGAEVILTTPEPREYRAPDAESLTEQVLGFRLPLAGLADWVRARAGPGPARQRFDGAGRLAELEQSGWKIEYLEWFGARPARLRLTYPGLELRLAISEWK
jgi:outer membrane lipoprotein LolB